MDAAFRVDALAEAMAQCGQPEIFNTDQGSQFASFDFTDVLKDAGVAISIDGRGRYIDNIFIERLWRSLKYKAVCLHELTDGLKAERVIPRVVNNHSFDGPRWLSGQARRGPRDAVPSDKRRQLPGKPPRATAGRSAKQGARVVAGCAGRLSWGRLTWVRTTARPVPTQQRKAAGQMGHYQPPMVSSAMTCADLSPKSTLI